MHLNRQAIFWMAFTVLLAWAPQRTVAGTSEAKNPPSECKAPDGKCECSEGGGGGETIPSFTGGKKVPNSGKVDVDSGGGEVSGGCIKVNLSLGRTTPWTGAMRCRLKVFADGSSPDVFTPDSLYASVGGYTFKRVGSKVMSDGTTPAEVVLSHPDGEPVRFVFAEGESLGRPDPGFHVELDERIQMTDAEGWATTADPVYYDLYVGDGTVRRFLATDITGQRGKLVSVTDVRGFTVTPEDMGVDIVYGADGVRQFLAPSRLADVTVRDDGYDVTIWPLRSVPVKDASTGLYEHPAATPVRRLSIRRANGGRRAVVKLRRGDGDEQSYVFDYARGDWSLTLPSGVQEVKDRMIQDSKVARTVKDVRSAAGVRLSRSELNYKWESWGFAATNRVEGFGGVTETTSWTYHRSGNGKGQVATELKQSGLLTEYEYDDSDRKVSETRSGPGMMTERITWDYAPVDQSDAMLPVDTRPRTVVRTLDGVECERTYYVYSALTNVVERAGTQGAAYGGTNALRTVTAYWPVVSGDWNSGRVRSVRHEDGRIDAYAYSLETNVWTETVTHLHELSPVPVDGKTTRDIAMVNACGEIVESRTEVLVEGAWHVVARERYFYNLEGRVVRSENLAGQETVTEWDCCRKVSETKPDGSTTTWDYDAEGRLVSTSRLIALDMTNVTWLTTCYEYDDLARETATWQTNMAAQVGLPAVRTRYDQLGRVVSRTDANGGETRTEYSTDGLIVTTIRPNGSTTVVSRNAARQIVSVTGTAVLSEFTSYGIEADGMRWTRMVQGMTTESPKFTKRIENMLGQTIRTERSGCNGAVLATVNAYSPYGRMVRADADGSPSVEYAYDSFGTRVSATRHADGEWQRNALLSFYVLKDGEVWQVQTNIVSCSDSAIAPQVKSASVQLTGLVPAIPVRTKATDERGNTTESWQQAEGSVVASFQRSPSAFNVSGAWMRYGNKVREVSISAVTNMFAYDALGRQIAKIDGRGNATRTEYGPDGRILATLDGAGNRTSYAYDAFGRLVAVTNPIGNVTSYEYDLRGRKAYEGGATYPVRYTYDVFGNKTTMMTYRNEASGTGDVTAWRYDEASGVMTNKIYADGLGPSYVYTDNGTLATRTWARGVVTSYAYDGWGNMTNMVYSDGTPTVSVRYDLLGRQVETHDAAGVTTFAYDDFGSCTNETVVGVAGTNVIERYWDGFGRSLGYSLNGERRTTLAYEPDTGRIASMLAAGSANAFRWTYLSGSDLKETLTYPNGDVVRWMYEPHRDLLTLVSNATHSVYCYTYDAAGRRVSKNDERYGYNVRDELILATNVVDGTTFAYAYDDIGNRLWSYEFGTNTTYTANELNQYTEIVRGGVTEHPAFDADGNQTKIKTLTGTWNIVYNAENRPILWSCGETNIFMSFDCRGRRVNYTEMTNNHISSAYSFIYDGRYCLARLDANNAQKMDAYTWNPGDKIATQLLMTCNALDASVCTYDGSKNVVSLIQVNSPRNQIGHFSYTAFGEDLRCLLNVNNWSNNATYRFSSEYFDSTLGLSYFIYRHYNPYHGRWLARDLFNEDVSLNLYGYCDNLGKGAVDVLGNCPAVLLFPGTWVVVAEIFKATVLATGTYIVTKIIVEEATDIYQAYADKCGVCEESHQQEVKRQRTREEDYEDRLNTCIEACLLLLPTGTHYGAPFQRCIRHCMGN